MKLPDNYQFAAVFEYYKGEIGITFPDIPGCTSQASSEEKALASAREALALHLYAMEVDNDPIPSPTPLRDVKCEEGEAVVLVDVYMPPMREYHSNKFVKKTLSIPTWLNLEAEHRGINFSKVLREALTAQLGL